MYDHLGCLAAAFVSLYIRFYRPSYSTQAETTEQDGAGLKESKRPTVPPKWPIRPNQFNRPNQTQPVQPAHEPNPPKRAQPAQRGPTGPDQAQPGPTGPTEPDRPNRPKHSGPCFGEIQFSPSPVHKVAFPWASQWCSGREKGAHGCGEGPGVGKGRLGGRVGWPKICFGDQTGRLPSEGSGDHWALWL